MPREGERVSCERLMAVSVVSVAYKGWGVRRAGLRMGVGTGC